VSHILDCKHLEVYDINWSNVERRVIYFSIHAFIILSDSGGVENSLSIYGIMLMYLSIATPGACTIKLFTAVIYGFS
jgi:hypothetical protein